MNLPDPHDDTRVIPAEKLKELAVEIHLTAIRQNQQFGLPMVYGQDGQVIHVDPFEAEAELLRDHPELAVHEPAPGLK